MSNTQRTHAQTKIVQFIKKQGARGATCYEVEAALGLLHQSASPAILKLREERAIQFQFNNGEMVTRPTQTGRHAAVYVAVA